MSLRYSRIVLLAFLFALLIAMALLWHAKSGHRPLTEADQAPWIGLPSDGMDASLLPVRRVLLNAGVMNGEASHYSSLAFQCGNTDRLATGERYIAHIGQSARSPFWRVTMDVEGSEVQVRIEEAHGTAPPPPPPPGGYVEQRLSIPSYSQTDKAKLSALRDAWSDYDLWLAPQKDAFGCLDGNPVLLEACVNGKYAARFRNCDGAASVATRKLWDLLNATFPAPKPIRWEHVR